jgi:hypothetical protein
MDQNDGGGSILNRENLTLNACVLTGNFAPNGGAILNTAGTLTLNDCTVSGNNGGDGGAALISGSGLAVTRSTIANNQVTNAGGGIALLGLSATIIDSTISGNFADESGGGLYQYGGSLSVRSSTISGNSADSDHDGIGSGGGIFSSLATFEVLNSTISGNSAGEHGAGVFSDTSQPVSLKFSTITGNVVANFSGSSGGGIHSDNVASLDHTIVAGNLQGASTRDDVVGSFDAFYSLIGDKRSEAVNNTGGSLIGTTAAPIDAKLGPLANNGGLTLTHALLSGSPAIEAGNPAAVAGSGGISQFDQRGNPFSRLADFDGVGGARIDIGAVEMKPAGPTLTGDYNLNHSVDAADYVLWRKTNGTSVAQYSGADGDGNSAVNANDYTVWRGRFGNASPGAGSAAEELSDEPVGSNPAAVSGGADAISLAFADLADLPGIETSPVEMIPADQSMSTHLTASADPLLALADAAVGTNQTIENEIGTNAADPVDTDAVRDEILELLTGELNSPLVAW